MASPTPRAAPGVPMSELVGALNAMRDALIQVSLLLQDYQHGCGSAQREMAAAQAKEWLKKLTVR